MDWPPSTFQAKLHESMTALVSFTLAATLRQTCYRVRSPQDELEIDSSLDTRTQLLGPAARDASHRVTAIFGALSVG